jgi:hypothetical protein
MDWSDVKSVFRKEENGKLVEAAGASDDSTGLRFIIVRRKALGKQ